MDAAVLPAEPGADQLVLVLFGDDEEHAVAGRAELRSGGILADAHRRATGRRNAVRASARGAARRGQIAALALFEHDRPAIRREAREAIMASNRGDGAWVSAACRHCADLA